MQVVRQSRLFETAPELVTDQPAFVNAAIAVKTDQTPEQLLSSLKAIEVRVAVQVLRWLDTGGSSPLCAQEISKHNKQSGSRLT